MTRSATSAPGPLEIYRRMQEAVLREATLLPTDLLAEDGTGVQVAATVRDPPPQWPHE